MHLVRGARRIDQRDRGLDARELLRRGQVDGRDARVRVRRSQQPMMS
jgi:hypothetical protein